MGDLKNPMVIWAKGALFLLLGLLSVAIILLRTRDLKVAALLAIAIWSFCRCYYFAFYVIEKYVDTEYRYSGISSLVRYSVGRKRKAAD